MGYEREKPRQDNVSKFLQKDGVEIFLGRLKNRPNPTGEPNAQLSRPIVSAETPFGASNACSNPTGYSGLAMMSLDGLLRPISLSGEGGLSRFARYSGFRSTGNSEYSQPPMYKGSGTTLFYNLPINQGYLNPIINPAGYEGITNFTGRYADGSGGHDIELLAQRPSGLPAGQSLVTCMGSGSGVNHIDTYSNDYRLLAMRGPILYQGWGYDLNGKPIPNEADNYDSAASGIFTGRNLTDKFMPDFMQKSTAWPVGPIDLRFDRNRGVWTAPTKYRPLRVRLLQDIIGTVTNPSGRGYVIENNSIPNRDVYFDSSGSGITLAAATNTGNAATRGEVIVYDRTNSFYLQGEDVTVEFDTDENRYYINERQNDIVYYYHTQPTVCNTVFVTGQAHSTSLYNSTSLIGNRNILIKYNENFPNIIANGNMGIAKKTIITANSGDGTKSQLCLSPLTYYQKTISKIQLSSHNDGVTISSIRPRIDMTGSIDISNYNDAFDGNNTPITAVGLYNPFYYINGGVARHGHLPSGTLFNCRIAPELCTTGPTGDILPTYSIESFFPLIKTSGGFISNTYNADIIGGDFNHAIALVGGKGISIGNASPMLGAANAPVHTTGILNLNIPVYNGSTGSVVVNGSNWDRLIMGGGMNASGLGGPTVSNGFLYLDMNYRFGNTGSFTFIKNVNLSSSGTVNSLVTGTVFYDRYGALTNVI